VINIILIIRLIFTTALAYWILRNPTEKWSEVTGKILEFKVVAREDAIYPDHPPIVFNYPKVRCEYRYEHRFYESTRVSLYERDVAVRNGEENYPWNDWKEDATVKVYVNSRNPNESVLLTKMASERMARYMQMIIGMYAALIGWYLMVKFFS